MYNGNNIQTRKNKYDTIVIGGGQAGLVTGYYLKEQGRDFVILDASERVGDAWRNRWDSLRVFTPARYCGLDGMPFPKPFNEFPTKDEMADYLEGYAENFELPVRLNTRVDSLTKENGHFCVTANGRQYAADNAIVAMANYQKPRVPEFAGELDPGIVQFHSSKYKNLSQLQEGGVLIVGAANSGAEIAMETVHTHPTWLSGPHPGHIPFRTEHEDGTAANQLLIQMVLRVAFHRVLKVTNPIGRKMKPKLLEHGRSLVRTKPDDMEEAGIERVPRTIGVQDGKPVLEDDQVMDVANVIWCTGYHPGFSWIDLPVIENGKPEHKRGIVEQEPGLYFVGLEFLYSASSEMMHAVGRDANHVVRAIEERSR